MICRSTRYLWEIKNSPKKYGSYYYPKLYAPYAGINRIRLKGFAVRVSAVTFSNSTPAENEYNTVFRICQ